MSARKISVKRPAARTSRQTSRERRAVKKPRPASIAAAGSAVDGSALQQLDSSSALEWLDTDGAGGYACGSVNNGLHRRYHGWFVHALHPPRDRRVLVSKLEEVVEADGLRVELGTNRFGDAVSPEGYRHLDGFHLSPRETDEAAFDRAALPTVSFAAAGGTLERTLASIQRKATVVVRYVWRGDGPAKLELRPFLAGREHHHLVRSNDVVGDYVGYGDDALWVRLYPNMPLLRIGVPGAGFRYEPDWYFRFEHAEERARGLDSSEDLWVPGCFIVKLSPGRPAYVALSTDTPVESAEALFERETRRRRRLSRGFKSYADWWSLRRELTEAAEAFVVRGKGGRPGIIAGYPWFGEWGRDTMIALPGLLLATDRLKLATRVIDGYVDRMERGLIPNRIAEDGAREYNTVDATLWMFVAIHHVLQRGGDLEHARRRWLRPMRASISWHTNGTHFGIGADPADGLLAAGEPGVQLTWMDARVGERVITPRHGKPVEVNALWFNALSVLAELERRCGHPKRSRALLRQAKQVRESFRQQFWNETVGHLNDVVDAEGHDASLRPNQLLAFSLPFPLFAGERGRRALDAVTEHLLTPRGLRTLSPEDPAYRGRCEGGPAERDEAYHQGTVWPWLIGAYWRAAIRLHGSARRGEARHWLRGFAPHLREACVGQCSEIFDGDAPHTPRGAFAQAWSVAELLWLIETNL